jgi:hypothetical protein
VIPVEIVRQMAVPAEYLYKTIIRSVLAEIRSQTGKNVSEKQLKGFEYIKTFSKNARATIRIEDLEKNKLYRYRTLTNKNEFLVSYEFHPLSENSCELRYQETMESYGYLQKINDAFVGMIWSKLRKRRFFEMLKQIEQSYGKEEQSE